MVTAPTLLAAADTNEADAEGCDLTTWVAPPGPSAPTKSSKRFLVCLSFLAGWANVVLFKTFGCFATMMTGNTLWFATALEAGRWVDAAFSASMVPAYLAGYAAFRFIDTARASDTSYPAPRARPSDVAPLVAALFLGGELLARHVAGAESLARKTPMLPIAAAFGCINGATFAATGTIAHMLTIHMQKLTGRAVDLAAGTLRCGDDAARRNGDVRSAAVITAFGLGAGAGAFALEAFPRVLVHGGASLLAAAYSVLFVLHDHRWSAAA